MNLDRKLQIASYICLLFSIGTAVMAVHEADRPIMVMPFAVAAFMQGLLWGARIMVTKRLTWL